MLLWKRRAKASRCGVCRSYLMEDGFPIGDVILLDMLSTKQNKISRETHLAGSVGYYAIVRIFITMSHYLQYCIAEEFLRKHSNPC